MTEKGTTSLSQDLFGGLAAMLVAFPSAVAFGLIVFAPLGPAMAGAGALAGMLGAIALGVIAPVFGGTPRLISAPSAPAAAVLAAFVAQKSGAGGPEALALMSLAAMAAGLLQFAFGALGGGRLMKYVPYPVVAGYLSGVGLLIMLTQLPKFLGLAPGMAWWQGLLNPLSWSLPAVAVGTVSVLAMAFSLRLTRAIPAPIIAMAAGTAAYFALSLKYPELLILEGNRLVIGPIPAAGLSALADSFTQRLSTLPAMGWGGLSAALAAAGTLSVLLSIDTLKSSVIVDAITHSRHDSNRELVGQSLGNLASGLLGGIPGSGIMGATLVNISSGGRSRLSGLAEGLSSAMALLLLGRLVCWIPLSALAGILLAIAFRMIDRKSFSLLRQRSTVFDFLVIASVAATAVAVNLIAAAGVGVGLSIILFIRDQTRSSVVRRLSSGGRTSSKRRRLPSESAILEQRGDEMAVYQLQGALFFGTTDQLYSMIEPRLETLRYVILDMRRVVSVDFTAAHMLEMLGDRVAEKGGSLAFSHIPRSLPSGQDLRRYFDQVGLAGPERNIRIFPDLDSALEWAEDRIIESEIGPCGQRQEGCLGIEETVLFRDLPSDARGRLRRMMPRRTLAAGETLFRQGDQGDELFIISRGEVRIDLPIPGRVSHHLATFGPGDFFGEIAFLDQRPRTAEASARTEAEIYVLSRAAFDRFAKKEPRLAGQVFAGLSRILAERLRRTDAELRALEEE